MFKRISRLYLCIMLFLLYLPIIYLTIFSFNSGDDILVFEGFSLKWYIELFSDTDLLITLIDTIILAIISSFFSTIIGLFGAITINSIKSKANKRIALGLNSIMIVSPDVIIGISLLLLFTFIKLPFGFFTVLLAHITFCFPIVVLMILPKLSKVNQNTIFAAYDLGASKAQVFFKIIIPQILPSLISSFVAALTYSLDDFAVTFFVNGNGFSTLGIEIYSTARQGISLTLNAMSTLIFLVTIVLALLYYFIENKRGENENID